MPKPYSHGLGGRALEACDADERPGGAGQRFRIGRSSVYLWFKQRREEGRDPPRKMGGGPSVIRDAVEAALKGLPLERQSSDLGIVPRQACRRERRRCTLLGGPEQQDRELTHCAQTTVCAQWVFLVLLNTVERLIFTF
jgi:hypothetical protein